MPDDAREIIFPDGVPIRQIESDPAAAAAEPPPSETDDDATASEGDLSNEHAEIEANARDPDMPEETGDLLADEDDARKPAA